MATDRSLYDRALDLLDKAIAEPDEAERMALFKQTSVLFRKYVRALRERSRAAKRCA